MDDLEQLAPAPEPVSQPQPAAQEPKGPVSTSDALDNAFDKIFGDDDDAIGKPDRARDERGKFKAKDAEPVKAEEKQDVKPEEQKPEDQKPFNPDEPPARLSAEAKAAWAALPLAVKADVHRTIKEMEGGIEKYRTEATRWQTEITPYENLAKQYGMDIKGVLADYEGMARMMATNPVQVFDTLAKRHGFTLQEVAAHVLQQDLDDYARQTTAEIKRLQAENTELKRQTQTFTERQQQEVQSFIADFAVKNPRYAELEPRIAGILRSGLVTAQDPRAKLQEAYDIADRLTPAAQVRQAPQNPDLAAQTRKGQLSVTGSPGAGSDPARRGKPASARDALDKAFDELGL